MNDNNNPYNVYVFHRSYFCGKMLAYLRYKEIPHTAIYESLAEVGPKLMANTGLRQMPVVETPDGEWLQDTTPMIDWFEERHREAPVLPDDPVVAFMTRLLEDYADEWLWRPAIYYRWMFKEDRYMYKSLFVEEFVGGFWNKTRLSKWIAGKLVHKHQRDKFLHGDGLTKANRQHVESIYLQTLDRLESIFQQQPFLLGDQPSLADFGFFGSMFWHFGNDPTANRIMQERAPAVYEWVARLWNARASRLSTRTSMKTVRSAGAEIQAQAGQNKAGEVPESWTPLIKDMCENYFPYLEQNALEYDKGRSRFDWQVEGYNYPGVHVSPYRVWCRERLQKCFEQLSHCEQTEVRRILDSHGGCESLLSHAEIKSNWDPQGIAPRCIPGKVPLKNRLLSRFTGTNHVRTRRAWATHD